MLLTRGLPLLVALGLVLYSLIDCLVTPAHTARNLPKWMWAVLILLFPVIGAVAWLLAGRPQRLGGRAEPGETGGPGQHRDRPGPIGPDDDPDFLRGLGRAKERRDEGRDQDER